MTIRISNSVCSLLNWCKFRSGWGTYFWPFFHLIACDLWKVARKIPTRIVRFSPRIWHFSYMRELLFSQPREKTNILVETRIAFLGRELLLGKSTKNSLNLWQTRITQRNVILVGIVWESLILVWFLDENYIKPRRELSFSLLENDNSRLNIVILPLIRGENHVIRGTITVSAELPSEISHSILLDHY